ncbi:hypothetical protein ACXR2U_02105 [Jatrophihabitans sp. YIM 134969]
MPHSPRPHRRATARVAGVLVAAVLATAGTLTAAGPAAAAGPNSLAAGAVLATNSSLTSSNGTYRLTMQSDGNLALYGARGAMWSTKTTGTGVRLWMQSDGNAVMRNAANAAVWTSRTAGSGATKLLLQDDGDVSIITANGVVKWHSNTAVVPTPVSLGSSVPAGTPLTPSAFLTSPAGTVTARFDTAGVFTIRTEDRVLWTAPSGGQPGKRFLFQTDGNVVLYGLTVALWTASTRNATPGTMTMQDDGNLIARSTSGAIVWSSRSPIPQPPPAATSPDRLKLGQALSPGQMLKSGTATITQQTDGNLVIRSAGTAIWTSNTAGWGAVTSTMQSDGNFVVRASNGQALWSTGTRGAYIMLQTDGNLVVRSSTNVALWASKSRPRPPVTFPPTSAPPPVAVSRYLRNLDGSSADLTFMRTAGCSDARAVPNGKKYLTFLAFGAQSTHAPGGWGVNLTASTGLISNTAVVNAVKSYVDGYRGCMQPYSHLTVAVGTNNDGEDAGLGAVGGKIWADQVVDPIAAYVNPGGRVTIAAANDIEPGFAGSPAQAVSWMQGFLANSGAPFVNTGSADGCPQTLGSTATCNFGWTPKVLYDLTYGMMAARSLPLVQIYFTSMARQWANISLIGRNATGRAMTFAGPLTEVTACRQAGSCTSMGAVDAWHTLWNQLRADSRTAISNLAYLTDLRIDW